MDSTIEADSDIDYLPNYVPVNPASRWFRYFVCEDDQHHIVTDIVNDAVRIESLHSPWDPEPMSLTMDDWREIGKTISQCKKLKGLIFDYITITEEILVALFQADGDYDFPLEVLNLNNNGFGTNGVTAILPFLRTRKELRYLLLSHNNIDNKGAALLAEVLDPMPVEYLDVSFNEISGEGIERIICYSEQSTLFLSGKFCAYGTSDLHYCSFKGGKESIGMKRHVAIGNCDFELEHHRDDHFHWFGLEMVETLLQCLKRTQATEVIMCANIPFSTYDDGKQATTYNRITEAMASIICNPSSIDALCNSNHDIKHFDLWNCGGPGYKTKSLALEINQRSDISTNQRLRCKLRSIYFQEDFSLLPFLSMEYVWIPYVLELLTISEKRLPDEDDDEDTEISIDGLTDEEIYEEELYREDKKSNDNQKMNLPKYIMCHEGDLNGTYHFVRNWNVPYLFDKRL